MFIVLNTDSKVDNLFFNSIFYTESGWSKHTHDSSRMYCLNNKKTELLK